MENGDGELGLNWKWRTVDLTGGEELLTNLKVESW
jgi:hypothetical protein